MDLQIHNEEGDKRMNEWLREVPTIHTERVSCEKLGDHLTKWDEDSYHVIEYVNGEVEKTLIWSKRPSVMLKHVEKVFNDWDLPLNFDAVKSLRLKEIKSSRTSFIFGDSWITVYMNLFHSDMLSDGDFGDWYKYKDGLIEVSGKVMELEEWISSVIIKEARSKPYDVKLQRIVKLKSLI